MSVPLKILLNLCLGFIGPSDRTGFGRTSDWNYGDFSTSLSAESEFDSDQEPYQ